MTTWVRPPDLPTTTNSFCEHCDRMQHPGIPCNAIRTRITAEWTRNAAIAVVDIETGDREDDEDE